MALIKADIMEVDIASLALPPPALITVAGNIPYYLTTPLDYQIVNPAIQPIIRKIYLMIQKRSGGPVSGQARHQILRGFNSLRFLLQ